MNDRLRKVNESVQDNLIAKPFPRALTFGVKIPGGTGVLKRGTVLELTADDTFAVLGTTAAANAALGEGEDPAVSEANCVLADPVDASGAEAVTAVAYRTGHFNRRALICAENYEMTVKDKEALRKNGILLSDMME